MSVIEGENLKGAYFDWLVQFTDNRVLIADSWREVETCHSNSKRYYHTLKQFIQMKEIYKTEYFKNKFEKQARENLQSELLHLSK